MQEVVKRGRQDNMRVPIWKTLTWKVILSPYLFITSHISDILCAMLPGSKLHRSICVFYNKFALLWSKYAWEVALISRNCENIKAKKQCINFKTSDKKLNSKMKNQFAK